MSDELKPCPRCGVLKLMYMSCGSDFAPAIMECVCGWGVMSRGDSSTALGDLWNREAAEHAALVRVRDSVMPRLLAVAKLYEAWEAKLVTDGDWESSGTGLPSLSQADYDELMRIQPLRNAALKLALQTGKEVEDDTTKD